MATATGPSSDPPVTIVSRTSPAVELADVLRIVQEQVAAAIGRAAHTHPSRPPYPSPGPGTLVWPAVEYPVSLRIRHLE